MAGHWTAPWRYYPSTRARHEAKAGIGLDPMEVTAWWEPKPDLPEPDREG